MGAGAAADAAGVEPLVALLVERVTVNSSTPMSAAAATRAIWKGRDSCAIASYFGTYAGKVERRDLLWTLQTGMDIGAEGRSDGVMATQYGMHDGIRGECLLSTVLHVLERGPPGCDDRYVAGSERVCVAELPLQRASAEIHLR